MSEIYLGEAMLGRGVALILVRVVLSGEPPKGCLHIRFAGVAAKTENFVGIAHFETVARPIAWLFPGAIGRGLPGVGPDG